MNENSSLDTERRARTGSRLVTARQCGSFYPQLNGTVVGRRIGAATRRGSWGSGGDGGGGGGGGSNESGPVKRSERNPSFADNERFLVWIHSCSITTQRQISFALGRPCGPSLNYGPSFSPRLSAYVLLTYIHMSRR